MSRTTRVASPREAEQPPQDEESRLRELGYRPVLAHRMGGFGNFAISFSAISVLSGCMTLYGFGMGSGGPAVMMWGWTGVGVFVLCVALALAELTSAYPTSGALSHMADRLGGRRWGWYTGWLNLLGLLGAIAGVDYGAALFTGAFLKLQWNITPSPVTTFLIFLGILLLHALLNLFGVRLVGVLNSISVWWHLAGVAAIVGALAIVPDRHRSPGFVFTEFVDETGWANPFYVAAVGLLLAQYTLSGYDASAHFSEETSNASVSAAKGIVRAVWASWIAGFLLLAGLTFAIQDYAGTTGTATGVPPAQIFLDALGADGAAVLLLVVIVAQLFCGNAEVAAASRMVFAFSRDNALPGSTLWRKVSSRSQTPVPAVWLCVVVAAVLALPSLHSATAYGAVAAVSVIGIMPSYAIPVYLRLRAGKRFVPGPWSLGRWSRPIGWIAVVWVACVTVLFCLPQRSPVTVDSMNYAVIALAVVLLLATVWWYVARRSYGTPSSYGTAREEAEIAEGIV